MSKTINQSKLDYFTGAALTGLLANPQFMSVQGQKYLALKNRTVESIAVESALEVMSVLERLAEQLTREEMNAAESEIKKATKLVSMPGRED